MPILNISDEEWLELNVNPERGHEALGFDLPSLPPDEVQKNFTGRSGRPNIELAFQFYSFIRENYLRTDEPTIMDFGSGWGRIARLFLRDTRDIWAVDTHPVALEWMRKTQLPVRVVESKPLPPIPELGATRFDLIYAFSVFSHLSEEYFQSWITHLLSLLKDEGVMVFTTRGLRFLNYIEKNAIRKDVFQDYEKIRSTYDKGDFQFIADRPDTAVLSGSWFGETFIPPQYLDRKFGAQLLDFIQDLKGIDQAVVVLSKS
jgi:hypothetical protein